LFEFALTCENERKQDGHFVKTSQKYGLPIASFKDRLKNGLQKRAYMRHEGIAFSGCCDYNRNTAGSPIWLAEKKEETLP